MLSPPSTGINLLNQYSTIQFLPTKNLMSALQMDSNKYQLTIWLKFNTNNVIFFFQI